MTERSQPDTTATKTDPSFDLDLFQSLVEQYSEKSVAPKLRTKDPDALRRHAEDWARRVDRRVGLRGKRVLEVGCGRGALATVLAEQYDCRVVGLDIQQYETWQAIDHPNVTLRAGDIADPAVAIDGPFDRIISLVVWEHVRHPFAALQRCRSLLADDGVFYLRANLYRSAVASHRYGEVKFPWSHLLFDDEVFRDYYRSIGRRPATPAWVNALSYADYHRYFELLGFVVEQEWLSQREFDEEFYKRFETQLGRYPVFDLTLDFFDVVLTLDPAADRAKLHPFRPRHRAVIDQLAGKAGPTGGQVAIDPRSSDSRSLALARRLSRKPRGLKFWLTLPLDVLRIAAGRL